MKHKQFCNPRQHWVSSLQRKVIHDETLTIPTMKHKQMPLTACFATVF